MQATMPPPKKNKKPLTMLLRLDADTAEALKAYIASHEVAPKRNPVIVTAIRRYLSERGFWPPRHKS